MITGRRYLYFSAIKNCLFYADTNENYLKIQNDEESCIVSNFVWPHLDAPWSFFFWGQVRKQNMSSMLPFKHTEIAYSLDLFLNKIF